MNGGKHSRLSLAAALTAAAAVGAGGGAGTYAALSSDRTKTVVREVPARNTQPAASRSSLSINEVYRRAYRAVVEITVATSSSPFSFGGSQTQEGLGSGFVYDSQGHVVTNAHVVDGASSISVRLWNGTTYKARLVGSDASTDLAVLEIGAPASILHPVALGDSSELAVGDGVIAIGSPFGLDGSVTAGIVSALHREMTSPNNYAIDDSIQTDAAINHGNSGGPLLNTQGLVIGVNSQIESNSGGNEGVGFAIPSNTVRTIVQKLIGSGRVEHAYLGVAIESSSAGARVARVNGGTPAASAGLQAGDVITAVDGKKIASADDLRSAIDARDPGATISVTYRRDGRSHTVKATLALRPNS